MKLGVHFSGSAHWYLVKPVEDLLTGNRPVLHGKETVLLGGGAKNISSKIFNQSNKLIVRPGLLLKENPILICGRLFQLHAGRPEPIFGLLSFLGAAL